MTKSVDNYRQIILLLDFDSSGLGRQEYMLDKGRPAGAAARAQSLLRTDNNEHGND